LVTVNVLLLLFLHVVLILFVSFNLFLLLSLLFPLLLVVYIPLAPMDIFQTADLRRRASGSCGRGGSHQGCR
jgi:hypothetical protein